MKRPWRIEAATAIVQFNLLFAAFGAVFCGFAALGASLGVLAAFRASLRFGALGLAATVATRCGTTCGHEQSDGDECSYDGCFHFFTFSLFVDCFVFPA